MFLHLMKDDTWITAEGQHIRIHHMASSHLKASIRFLRDNAFELRFIMARSPKPKPQKKGAKRPPLSRTELLSLMSPGDRARAMVKRRKEWEKKFPLNLKTFSMSDDAFLLKYVPPYKAMLLEAHRRKIFRIKE